MAILFSSSDDCRWPKIQFKKPEKMFFVSREFSRFVNFTYLQHFCHYFHHVYCFFDDFSIFLIIFLFFDAFLIIHFFIKNQSLIFRKKMDNQKINTLIKIMKKTLKRIWFSCFSSLFCKNNLQKCFKKPFLGPTKPPITRRIPIIL